MFKVFLDRGRSLVIYKVGGQPSLDDIRMHECERPKGKTPVYVANLPQDFE